MAFGLFGWCLFVHLFFPGPPDTLYEGGFFAATLDFPSDFPNAPPVMTFTTQLWHPNGLFANIFMAFNLPSVVNVVFEDGKVCISILHPPGEDAFNEAVGYFLACL